MDKMLIKGDKTMEVYPPVIPVFEYLVIIIVTEYIYRHKFGTTYQLGG